VSSSGKGSDETRAGRRKDPPTPDPADDEPAASAPGSSSAQNPPVVTDPSSTDQMSTDPESTAPETTGPETASETTDSETAEAVEPEGAETEETGSREADPGTAAPEDTAPDPIEPQAAPANTGSETAEPDPAPEGDATEAAEPAVAGAAETAGPPENAGTEETGSRDAGAGTTPEDTAPDPIDLETASETDPVPANGSEDAPEPAAPEAAGSAPEGASSEATVVDLPVLEDEAAEDRSAPPPAEEPTDGAAREQAPADAADAGGNAADEAADAERPTVGHDAGPPPTAAAEDGPEDDRPAEDAAATAEDPTEHASAKTTAVDLPVIAEDEPPRPAATASSGDAAAETAAAGAAPANTAPAGAAEAATGAASAGTAAEAVAGTALPGSVGSAAETASGGGSDSGAGGEDHNGSNAGGTEANSEVVTGVNKDVDKEKVESRTTGEPEGDTAVGAAADAGEGRGSGRRRKPRSRAVRIARRVVFGVLGLLLLAVTAFTVAYLLTPVPSPQEDAIAQGPEFYYNDGKTLIAKIGVNRQKVDLEQVPEHVRDAVIAAENRSFYDDPGVSVRGTIRAFWSTVTGEQLQGGSTITQQMVRNYYQGLGQERTISRKFKEIMVALKVDSQRDKDWILEQYLNTIFFGRDAYGIQAAAHAYYNKDVSQLTKAEAAYLAAAIQQPTPFGDPTGENRAMTEGRWRSVVRAMVETGALTPDEAARMQFPMPVKQKVTDVLKGQVGYMVRIAQKELRERRGYTEDEINRSGLKITTTFDKQLMDAAEKAVKANLPKNTGKTTLTGLVSVDPKTGEVVAFYGGRDYLVEQLSTSFGHWAQAGSGFKPIVLAAALDAGKTLNTTVNGASPQYYNGHPVRNSGGTSYGYINLVTATQNSVNTAYVNLGQEIGLDKVTDLAVKMGIPKDQLTRNGANKAPTFPLGVASVRVVQQAGVYATFASEGVFRTPHVIKSVKELDGDEHTYTEKGKRVFSTQVARDATYAMTKVVESGTGTAARLFDGRDVAGKTGTTDNGNALWFNGFIPQMATSVAIFRSDSPVKQVDIGGYSAYGGVLPAQIWRSYMTEAVSLKNLPPKSFGPPSTYAPGGGVQGPAPDAGDSTGRPNGPSGPDLSPPSRDEGPGTGGPSGPGGPPEEPEEPQLPEPPFEPPTGGGGGRGGRGGDGGDGLRGMNALPQQNGTFTGRRS